MTILLFSDSRRPMPGDDSHGTGWWVNSRTGAVERISSDELGPNGDHDGWIAIGDHAMRLGVSAADARAYQEAHYGFVDKKLVERAPKFVDRDGYVPGLKGVETARPRYMDLYERVFAERHAGVKPRDAAALEFPRLFRFRRWPSRGKPALLTVVSRWSGAQGAQGYAVRSSTNLLLKKYPNALDGVGRVRLECGPLRGTRTLDDFLNL